MHLKLVLVRRRTTMTALLSFVALHSCDSTSDISYAAVAAMLELDGVTKVCCKDAHKSEL